MGRSVFNQVDNNKYFCISYLNAKELKKHGFNMTLAEFKKVVRHAKPYGTVITGEDSRLGQARKTNIYRYEDFAHLKGGGLI